MLLEFSDNYRRSGSLLDSLSPLLFHISSLVLNLSYGVRVMTHFMYNALCREVRFKTTKIDFRERRIEPLEGVYETTPSTRPYFFLEKALVFENKKVYKTSDLLGEDIESGRMRIQVQNTHPGTFYQDYFAIPHKEHSVGLSFGVGFGLLSKRNIINKLAGLNTRFAPHRIQQTSPIKDWVEALIAGEMPENNPRYKYVQHILLLLQEEEDFPVTDIESLLTSLKDGTWCLECSPQLVNAIEQLHLYKWNTFEAIYDRHFKPGDDDTLKIVKPMTVSQFLKQASCSRIRAKYKKEVEKRGLKENELDATFVMSIPQGADSDCIFVSDKAKTVPIFIKNEKYGLKNQRMTREFLELCHYNGVYPESFDAELPEFAGYKPRIISAVPMGVPEEEVPGGQFLLCFYSTSIKKAVAEILEVPRTVVNSITMQEKQVIFHFITNTRSTPLDRPKPGKFWESLLSEQYKKGCIGKTTTEVLRKAYHSAKINRIINVLIHGDDSLMLYPIKGAEEPLFIECDYSAYDTSQADDAIMTEHQFYKDWFIGLPDGFVERSISHHFMPFSFKGGKELADSDGDFYKFKVHLEEAMRLSGGWNTTIGNSLISAMIILYVIGSCRDRDMEIEGFTRILPIPRFNTYSDLRVRVKPEAFSYSFDPRNMSFLKMGIAETSTGYTFVLLPSRILRAFSLLTIDFNSLGPNNLLRTRINEILFETFHGYTVQTDFPILGILYRSIYWSIISMKTFLALKVMEGGNKEDRFNEPETMLSNFKKGMSTLTNLAELTSPTDTRDLDWLNNLVFDRRKMKLEKSYSPSAAYSGSFRTTRQDVMDMILTRYNGVTSETGLIEQHQHVLGMRHVELLEKKLMPIDGLRTYHIEDAFLQRMAQKDYSFSTVSCVPSFF